MSAAAMVLNALRLFTPAKPVWSPQDAAKQLKISLATSYRYFNVLMENGLVERIDRNRYALGPAIIELDRHIRLGDAVLKDAVPAMEALLRHCKAPATALLCRYYRQRVMCVHQASNRPVSVSSYERGRPRPLFRGATSKIILAHLPVRVLPTLWTASRGEIPGTFEDFRSELKALKRAGFCISRGEVDRGRIGIAAPVFDGKSRIVGSLSIVTAANAVSSAQTDRLAHLVAAAARDLAWPIRPHSWREPDPARNSAQRGRP